MLLKLLKLSAAIAWTEQDVEDWIIARVEAERNSVSHANQKAVA